MVCVRLKFFTIEDQILSYCWLSIKWINQTLCKTQSEWFRKQCISWLDIFNMFSYTKSALMKEQSSGIPEQKNTGSIKSTTRRTNLIKQKYLKSTHKKACWFNQTEKKRDKNECFGMVSRSCSLKDIHRAARWKSVLVKHEDNLW